MIEEILYEYLGDSLSAPVYLEIPKDYPSRFYVIEKTGGAQVNHIKSATVAIKSYGESMYDAANMNEELKDAMLYGLAELAQIASVRLNSDYNFTDTTTKQYRYQAVFDIRYY
ncbi:MAG: hypothetical protein IIY21_06640 [Clostridiales bacterium]|nr:hypothetical protein [Clostridiales bacterium]